MCIGIEMCNDCSVICEGVWNLKINPNRQNVGRVPGVNRLGGIVKEFSIKRTHLQFSHY